VVSSCLFQTELERLEVRNLLVIREEVFASTSGFDAATPASIVAPHVVTLFVLLVTLDPIPDLNVGRASKEQELPILVEVILTFHRIIIITFITQGCEPFKVMVSKQIMGAADHIPPPQMIGFKAFVRVIHNVYEGIHTSLSQQQHEHVSCYAQIL
jgi:hypothetical protein